MEINVRPIDLGIARSFVIKGEAIILIGGGSPGKADDFLKGIEGVCIEPEEIQLTVVTHGHWDRFGSVSAISEFTGADIAIH